MQYRKDKQGMELSALGFGCMRFPRREGKIDLDETEREIVEAVGLGINYFDTAYIYGGSEEALGKILERNRLRDKVRVATKLPQYLVTKNASLDKYFSEQLKRLRTDRVEYYLMHHLTDLAMWEKLKGVGAIEWLDEKKRSGEIGAVGFSYHGSTDGFLKILGDYDWDLCQIQYNYFDEHSQAGVEGLRAAGQRGIPVVIMEPLRGGKLVSMLPRKAEEAMEKSGRGWTPAEWSFRWLYNQPEVTVVLSGMNSGEMLRENCRTASDARIGQFTDEDFAVLREVTERIREREKVGCTGCRYCMPCPKGVDIPGYFRCYNAMSMEDAGTARKEFIQTVGLTKEPAFASQCVGCGRCEQHCPQGIPIREMLKKADQALRPFPYNAVISLGRRKLFPAARSGGNKKG
ncbi:MAG: aldo/keto reductase [Clostridiales bacterium]|nr:aldo/keto reductase [Clostridiales bacterium]